jgi:hypothetical protein
VAKIRIKVVTTTEAEVDENCIVNGVVDIHTVLDRFRVTLAPNQGVRDWEVVALSAEEKAAQDAELALDREMNAISDKLSLDLKLYHCIISLPHDDIKKAEANELFAQGAITFKCDQYSRTITSPTWHQAIQCAEESIGVNSDFHHVFLEGFSSEEDGVVHVFFGS